MGAPDSPLRVFDSPAATVPADAPRRFGGVARVYGTDALRGFGSAHVCVVGIGGVGSWAAEALARSGIGRLTLIDADHVAESNVNRQVHAMDSTLGAAKIAVMRDRVADIAPDCVVHGVDDFVTVANVADLVPADAVVIDAIDAPRAKAAMIACVHRRAQAIVVCGAAGGRTDPLRLRRGDLSSTRGDALLASVRARLRREHAYARGGASFGIEAIWSDEPLPPSTAASCTPVSAGGAPLGCAGYGSLVTVTAAMGLAAAARVLAHLADLAYSADLAYPVATADVS